MSDRSSSAGLPHLLVIGRVDDREFRRRGGGDPRIRSVERRAHGERIEREAIEALEEFDSSRTRLGATLDELSAVGAVIVLEGEEASYPIRLDSLDRYTRSRNLSEPKWLLLSVTPATDYSPERAMIWVSDSHRQEFLRLFEDYLKKLTKKLRPRNRELVANINAIRLAILRDLWQSNEEPPTSGTHWWELWLRPTSDCVEQTRNYADRLNLRVADRFMRLGDRTIVWIEAPWDALQALPFSSVPVTEVRSPQFIDSFEDLSQEEQFEYVEDLATRITPAGHLAPAVCHLDTGILKTHLLLNGSISESDMHTLIGESPVDRSGHGTLMAGLALFGPLDEELVKTSAIVLRHRLESVKILPEHKGQDHDPLAYGLVMAQAVSVAEVANARARVFCMPVTAPRDSPGVPTLWSASIDALSAGVDIAQSDSGIDLLDKPDSSRSRLFIVSAGNVDPAEYSTDYRSACDLSAIEDPAQSWNTLTVGAYTDLVSIPDDPSFLGWEPLAAAGDISPHSRTSVLFGPRMWPLKPDICMEGGNFLFEKGADIDDSHPLLSLRTTANGHTLDIASVNATSAATAQASRLACAAMAQYPDYWPETVRALMVHAADWTPTMRTQIDHARTKTEKQAVVRRYGWGVPTEQSVLSSSRQAVTLVSQDEFVPFEGNEWRARRLRLHELPWPKNVLEGLGEADVTLRVTLSYYVEPNASRRGWRRRYAYGSHGLRFELKAPTETTKEFVARVNQQAQREEDGSPVPESQSDRWFIGPNQRNLGSLHQDLWEGSGADLAECGSIAVHPVGGWWKNNKSKDREGLPVRYSLLVSLRTSEVGVDLYTPIATELSIPVDAVVTL